MIGTKILKPLNSETEKQYTELANWCNSNQCIIKDFEDYYIVTKPDPVQENEVDILRFRREQECFPIINRGQFWYDSLTFDQKQELSQWYQTWLNVTNTKQAPKKPEWLEGKASDTLNNPIWI
ncbi:MAG: hypothetical protein LBN07_05255 [Christensenellaceae bacterium]|jgi:hypothetical protein|nr:hypothetical protein [Christensenellaceae bacterium]